jgi:hypothetical protein
MSFSLAIESFVEVLVSTYLTMHNSSNLYRPALAEAGFEEFDIVSEEVQGDFE